MDVRPDARLHQHQRRLPELTPLTVSLRARSISRRPTHSRQPLRRRPSSAARRSEEHTSELQSLMRISYAVFCLKKKTHSTKNKTEKLRYKGPIHTTAYLLHIST